MKFTHTIKLYKSILSYIKKDVHPLHYLFTGIHIRTQIHYDVSVVIVWNEFSIATNGDFLYGFTIKILHIVLVKV